MAKPKAAPKPKIPILTYWEKTEERNRILEQAATGERQLKALPPWLLAASLKAAGRMFRAERIWRTAVQRKRRLELKADRAEAVARKYQQNFDRHVAACQQWLAENPIVDYEI